MTGKANKTAAAWLGAMLMGVCSAGAQGTITFVGVTYDVTDFQALGFGQAGFYFPQFGATAPVTQRPTWENMQFQPPPWAGFQFDVTQTNRTFSPDAGYFSGDVNDPMDQAPPFGNPLVLGVYSKGGQPGWNTFTLPNGVTGLSGAVVDEWAANNSNNTINRIQLLAGTPASFFLRLVVDNTNLQHDPAGRLRPRGEPSGDVLLTGLTFNGIADVYTFRFDNFLPGNIIKVQLNSGVPGEAPSLGGIMFDVVPEPLAMHLLALGLVALCCRGIARRR
ncbi:MAG: hypothetical protein N3I86_11540 [Verrucomicrobiae bacterium]|nr:hypothetical protein [Verrucomicrobiae bacterium]